MTKRDNGKTSSIMSALSYILTRRCGDGVRRTRDWSLRRSPNDPMECKGISLCDSIHAHMTMQVSLDILSAGNTPALSPAQCKSHSLRITPYTRRDIRAHLEEHQ